MFIGSDAIEQDRQAIVDGLSNLLADTYVLYLKTHDFHWNANGAQFRTLHLIFEDQYIELGVALDRIAERICQLGFPASGTYLTYARISAVKQGQGVNAGDDMLAQLIEGQQRVLSTAQALSSLLQQVDDSLTADLLARRIAAHQTATKILRGLLDDKSPYLQKSTQRF